MPPDPRSPTPSSTTDRGRRFALVVAFALLLPPMLAAATGWEKVASERGVRVYIREVPGRDVPRFKGVATIDADPLLLLAVLADVERACEWNAACVHARMVQKRSEFDLDFHNRLKATWPVSDRDAVLRTSARIEDGGNRVYAEFRAIQSAPAAAKGVVRFPMLHGRYTIRRNAKGGSNVEYVIDADPGGWVPNWFVKYAVKNVPLDTLTGLRRQAAKRAADYADFVARHRPPPPPPAPPHAP